LDLHLTPYKVIATGEDQGMIEVVLNSATVANIQKAEGGVTGAFKQSTIVNWYVIAILDDGLLTS
jgi:hypothetical protein